MCFGLKLPRVLDALTIRFYEFPMEVVQLVQLRYLALTCNANLPPSIFKLWNLRCLIIHQYLSIISTVAQSYQPVEIWDLQYLEYLQVMGRNLPNPPRGAVLRGLLTLLDVGAQSCSRGVLERIPKLQKLRVQIELVADAAEHLSFFDNFSSLKKLLSFQCTVVNPELMSEIVAPPLSLDGFAILTKLTLSGSGYPWKDMDKIAQLSRLQVLKLKCYAFRGKTWKAKHMEFSSLFYLSIEDSDLVQWKVEDETFPKLFSLTIRNCYKLQEIPEISAVREIRVVDCKPSAVTCAKQMAKDNCRFYVGSSWGDGSFMYEGQLGPKGFQQLYLRRLDMSREYSMRMMLTY